MSQRRPDDTVAADPGRVLRRSLAVWGAGHLMLGLRRGWILAFAEAFAVLTLLVYLVPRAQGTATNWVFAALAGFFVAWGWQAVSAYRRALRRTRGPSTTAGRVVITIPGPARSTRYALVPRSAAALAGPGRPPEVDAEAAAGDVGPGPVFGAQPGRAFDAQPGPAMVARLSDPATGYEPAPGPWDREALQILALLVPATLVFTMFWVLCGTGSSPEAALQHYLADWQTDSPARAIEHLADAASPDSVAQEFSEDSEIIETRLQALAAELGPESGLDPSRPFASLTFTIDDVAGQGDAGDTAGQGGAATTATAVVDIVRHETVRDTFLGILPTASIRTVSVARIGTIQLRLVELPAPFGIGPPDHVWRVGEIAFSAAP